MMRRAVGFSAAVALLGGRSCSSSSGAPRPEEFTSTSSGEGQPAFKINPKKITPEELAAEGSNLDSDSVIASDATKAGYDKFGFPVQGAVEAFSKAAMMREGRAGQVKAKIHDKNHSADPIIVDTMPAHVHKKNIYDIVEDIPQYVQPEAKFESWGHHRERYAADRNRLPLWQRVLRWMGGLFVGGTLLITGVTMKFFEAQPREIEKLREEILQNAYGKILEIGAGGGQNIGLHPYPVEEIVMADRDRHQLQRLRYRIPKTSYPKYAVRRIDVSLEDEDFPREEFDCVIDMFGLCHYDDPVAVLKQMQRVVKPTGTIILLEHGKSHWLFTNPILDYYAESHTERTMGCHWNKDMEEIFRQAGIVVKEYRTHHFGTTKYVVAYPEPLTGGPSLVESEKQYQEKMKQLRLEGAYKPGKSVGSGGGFAKL